MLGQQASYNNLLQRIVNGLANSRHSIFRILAGMRSDPHALASSNILKSLAAARVLKAMKPSNSSPGRPKNGVSTTSGGSCDLASNKTANKSAFAFDSSTHVFFYAAEVWKNSESSVAAILCLISTTFCCLFSVLLSWL